MRRAIAFGGILGAALAASAANPITTSLFTADPGALVFRDTLWLFTGHDENAATKSFVMNDWYVFSTADLANYRNWGSPLKATDFPWASGSAFASHVIERDGTFYWYVSALHRSIRVNEGFAIGVATASHPRGPWKPLSQTLVTDNTANSVDLNIDPAVVLDADGTPWLYWGSWNAARRVRLKDNMTETTGAVETVAATGFFEAPWVHRFDGNYYLSYASGYPSTTNYAMSPRLAGPWVAKGVINTKIANSETNHQAILRFGGLWLFVYHTGDAPGGMTYHRSVSVDALYYNTDGTIKPIVRTATGPKKVDNAPLRDGTYRLRARHSGLVLQDAGAKVVQLAASASDSQVWSLERLGSGRTYALRNAGTGRYFAFPSRERLAVLRTQAEPANLVIENASAEDGYLLFADSAKDLVADVLDISKEAGKELVVWIRTGTLNQAFQFEPTVPSGTFALAGSKGTVRILSADRERGIRLDRPVPWSLHATDGSLLGEGVSASVRVPGNEAGLFLLRLPGETRALLLR